MSVETTHIATCDRCGETEVIGWDAKTCPDGNVLPPDGWRQLRGGAIEQIDYDSTDLCEDCQDDLEKWVKNNG